MTEKINVIPPTSEPLSVNVTESTSVPHQHKDVHLGVIGRGYNILYGSIKGQLFDEIKAKFTHGEEKRTKKHHIYKDFQEYERAMAKRIGISEYTEGMLSLLSEGNKFDPFLVVDKLENTRYMCMEVKEDYYSLELDCKTVKSNINEQVSFAKDKPFSQFTKCEYYSIFEKFGTHFINRVHFGAKAEMCWSYEEKFFDILDKVTKSQKFKKKFLDVFAEWKEANFSESFQTKGANGYSESRKTTNNFASSFNSTDKTSVAEQIGFQVEEISELIEDKNIRNEFEIAIPVYLEEMRPIRDPQFVNDGAMVGIYNPDTRRWIRIDPSGHLLLSNSSKLNQDCKFEVKKKGGRIGLKSNLYGGKLVSRGLTRPTFSFHRLQFMGPHESFQICGDYLLICGNLSAPTFLTFNNNNNPTNNNLNNSGNNSPIDQQMYEVYHDGSSKRRTRLLLLNLTSRSDIHDKFVDETVLECKYDEDLVTEVKNDSDSSDYPKSLLSTFKQSLNPIYKANSTSSLFIKETIHLPNIDEMTRRMAAKIMTMMREVTNVMELMKYDIFNEEQFPLSNNPTSFHTVSFETVFHFLNTIFKVEKLAPETSVMSMIYLQRVLLKTKSNLTVYNWRRMILSTLILASKVFEDLAVWNADFIELFPGIGVQALNKLEKHLLTYLDFNVSFTRTEYATEYFDLCKFTSIEHWEGKPLDEEALKQMEAKSAVSERIHLAKVQKSVSITVLPSQSTSVPHKKDKSDSLAILS